MGVIMERGAAKFWLGGELPDGVSYLIKNHPDDKWTAVTYKQINAKRKKECEYNIRLKVNTGLANVIKPGYIWVFKVDGWLFGGWWIYIKTAKEDYGINFRHHRDPALVLKAMQLFSCGVVPEMENFDFWAKQFAKRYAHVGFKRNENQGLKICRCEINAYGNLIDIFK